VHFNLQIHLVYQ